MLTVYDLPVRKLFKYIKGQKINKTPPYKTYAQIVSLDKICNMSSYDKSHEEKKNLRGQSEVCTHFNTIIR
jgi:hypothetical protein